MNSFHYFRPEIAAKYGVNAAVLLENIAFWVEKNRANGKHCHGGLYWTYNSVRAFEELFPYMSASAVRTAIQKLIADGLIVTGNFNSSAYDRTAWYALTEKGNFILQNGNFHLRFLKNGNSENDKPIPDNKPDNKPDINTDNNPPYPPFSDSPILQTAFDDWIKYKKERNDTYKPRGLKALITEIRNNAGKYGAATVANLINECMAANYQGIIWDKLKRRNGQGWDFSDLGRNT